MSHCFISYSTADGVELLQNLVRELEGGTPYIPAWYDTRNIPPGTNWDDEIVEAIKACKCMLFVMSNDSTKPSSDCRKEILFALRYKKPIVPLLIHKNAEPIFMIATREWIDFSDFNVGLGKLRKYIQELDLPVGQLRLLKERLSDAEHDLRRATGEEAERIKTEIEELNKEFEAQKRIADNPQAAQEQTQANIAAGLERERQPQMPIVGIKSSKFINPPPGIAPNYFQDRTVETKQILDFLKDGAQRMFTIVGRGGVGKTAMVCRLLKHLENSAVPEDVQKAFPETQPVSIDGIIYLSESGSHRVNFANIFYDLCKLLTKETAQELDAVYKNPQGSTESKMRALLEKFTGNPIVLLLDNFEPLVDDKTFEITDAELNEALLAFLNGTHTAVNIIITTRIAPKKLNLVQPGRQRPLDLDDGLESPYAENILREMDRDGRLGLKTAPNELLKQAKEKTRGFPRALEALYAILASDRYTSLEEILNTAGRYLPETVVQELVGEAFNRLDTNAQKVMQALAVYNRPVTPAAVDYLLAPHLPAMDSAPILQRLASMHFARKESGRFYLHPVDREFAYGLIPEKDLTTKYTKVTKEEEKVSDVPDVSDVIKVKLDDVIPASDTDDEAIKREKRLKEFQALIAEMEERRKREEQELNAFAQHSLLKRAANYYKQARKPRAEWKKLEDLSAQLAEFDLRCAAGDYDTAASVLVDMDFNYLLGWGHYHMMIKMHEMLQGKVNDKELARMSIGKLGLANDSIGKVYLAVEYEEKALQMAREMKNRSAENAWLSNLGNAYSNLGNTRKAIEYYKQALDIASETRNRKSEAGDLCNLGDCHYELGETKEAIDYCEQALKIAQELQDRRSESLYLGNMGGYYCDYENTAKSIALCKKSIQIADEIGSVQIQNGSRLRLSQAHLFQNDLVNARVTIEAALGYDVPENNHNASALHGIIALRQGDEVTARGAFLRAIGQADEILSKTAEYYSALDAKGLSICGLAICRSRLGRDTGDAEESSRSKRDLQDAIETFRKARKIAPHAGVVKSVLRLFDELVKCEGGEILKDVRSAIEVAP